MKVALSVLNLAPVRQGESEKGAIESMVELARATEAMGYKRYWIAEHHNAPTLMSSATSILMKHTLDRTERIRIGSGGIMLPNHSPLIVAEQFGTMATVHPGRLDLGLGRAPGTDMLTASALRRSNHTSVDTFADDVRSLLSYLGPEEEQSYVKAYQGVGTKVPIYILGSSTHSAYLAAELGLPYVFAAHFAPRYMEEALSIYRRRFRPSEYLDHPYVTVCLNVVATETDQEAEIEKTTMQQFFLNVAQGKSSPLSPPVNDMSQLWSVYEKEAVASMTRLAFVGGKKSIKEQLDGFQNKYSVNEIMAVTYIYDSEKQKRSYQILKAVVQRFN